MNILVADDEISMLKIISAYLNKEGFNVFEAKDGEEALDIIENKKIDLAILDWMIPKFNGIEVCKYIKENSEIKVLVLTAKSQNEDEIEALNIGADEYIRKPFDPRVLMIRVKKILGYQEKINIKDLSIDIKSNKVYKEGKELNLTKTELDLLNIFILNKGIILSREKILNLVWGINYNGDYRTVDTHIRRLRSKIGEEIIKTYRVIGYGID